MPGQALVRDHAQRVQVGRGRRGRTGHPFRRQVGGGPDQHPGLGDGGVPHRAGDPEVRDLDQAIGPDEQVAGLDVAVDQAGPVGGGQPPGRLGDDVHHVFGRQRAVVQDPGQGQAFHQLHDQVSRLGGYRLPVVEDLGDVRVRQRAGMMGLGPEPGQAFLVVGVLRPDHLDRHPAVDGQVCTTPDLPHPPGRDEQVQPVPPPKHKPRHPHTMGPTRTRDDHSSRNGTEVPLIRSRRGGGWAPGVDASVQISNPKRLFRWFPGGSGGAGPGAVPGTRVGGWKATVSFPGDPGGGGRHCPCAGGTRAGAAGRPR